MLSLENLSYFLALFRSGTNILAQKKEKRQNRSGFRRRKRRLHIICKPVMSDCNAQGSVEHNMPRGCEQTQTKPTPDPRPTTTVQALDNLQQTPNQAQTHTTPTPECNTRPKPRFLKSLSGASHPASAFSIRVRWPRRENRNRAVPLEERAQLLQAQSVVAIRSRPGCVVFSSPPFLSCSAALDARLNALFHSTTGTDYTGPDCSCT